MRNALLILSLLAGCGGGGKPAANQPAADPAADSPDDEASCCCDYIKEEGDPEGDTWSENQTYELMTAQGCADLSGACTDAASCVVEE